MNERSKRGIAAQQNKVGGAVIGQFMHGTNKLSPAATLESADFETGVVGFQLKGDGTAEFGDMDVRGTITGATLVGSFKTSASGPRVEAWDNGTYGIIEFYSGVASETAGDIYAGVASTRPFLSMSAPGVGGSRQVMQFEEITSGERKVLLDAGKPNAGSRGPIKLQSSGEGKISGRGYDMAPFANIPTQSSGSLSGSNLMSGNTLTYGIDSPRLIAQSQTTPLYATATPGLYYGTYAATFPNGVLGVVITGVRNWGALLIAAPPQNYTYELDHDTPVGLGNVTSRFYVYVLDDTGADVVANLAVCYFAIGW